MAAEQHSGHYALLSFGDLRIAFSQADVAQIGLAIDVDPALRDGKDCGALVSKEARWPVYSLDAALAPALTLPERRRFCVCLRDHARGRAFALSCESVTALTIGQEMTVEDLPECMQTPSTPLRQVVTGDGALTFLSSATSMADYLAMLEARGE
ncbi:MAG: hypothetical protein AB1810_14500 [Pseudomonadota bacterium]